MTEPIVYQGESSRALEILVGDVLERVTGVNQEWLKTVKPVFRTLVKLAQEEKVSDADLVYALEQSQKKLPNLFDELDIQSISTALEEGIIAQPRQEPAAAVSSSEAFPNSDRITVSKTKLSKLLVILIGRAVPQDKLPKFLTILSSQLEKAKISDE